MFLRLNVKIKSVYTVDILANKNINRLEKVELNKSIFSQE